MEIDRRDATIVMLITIADAIAVVVVGALLFALVRHMIFFVRTRAVYLPGKKVMRSDEPGTWWLIVTSYVVCMVIAASFLVTTLLSFGQVVPD